MAYVFGLPRGWVFVHDATKPPWSADFSPQRPSLDPIPLRLSEMRAKARAPRLSARGGDSATTSRFKPIARFRTTRVSSLETTNGPVHREGR